MKTAILAVLALAVAGCGGMEPVDQICAAACGGGSVQAVVDNVTLCYASPVDEYRNGALCSTAPLGHGIPAAP